MKRKVLYPVDFSFFSFKILHPNEIGVLFPRERIRILTPDAVQMKDDSKQIIRQILY